MSDYTFWRDALAGLEPPIHVDQPQPGLYKARRLKGGPLLPVVIWQAKPDGRIVAQFNGESVDPNKVWSYCADKPVSKADHEHFKAHGRWPGEIEAPPIGHNSLSLADEIADAVEQAQAWLAKNVIADKVTADTCSNMRERLRRLAKKADDEREEKKRPHREAADAIQREYMPMVESAKGAAAALGNQLTKYLAEEDARVKAEHAAAAKAAHEKAAAERAEMDPIEALDAPLPQAMPPPKVQAGGQAGKKTGLKTVTKFRVVDMNAMFEAVKDDPQMAVLAGKIAFARMRAGVAVPGVERYQEQQAT